MASSFDSWGRAALLTSSLIVGACGGGGSSPTGNGAPSPMEPGTRVTGSTPVERLDHVLEAADTAFLPSMYVKGSVSALAETQTFDETLHFTCEGVRCTDAEGFEIEFVSDDDADADDVE